MKPKPMEIIEYLNEKAGKRFRLTAKHRSFINARINEKYELEDFKIVVDKMIGIWGKDPVMAKFLRPETLFGNKMDGYLNSPYQGEIQEPQPKSSADKKREVGDKWLEKSQEVKNGQNNIPERSQGILGIGRIQS